MSITKYIILIVIAAIGIILGRYLAIYHKEGERNRRKMSVSRANAGASSAYCKLKKIKKTYEKTAEAGNKNTPANPYNEIINLLNKNKVEYQISKYDPAHADKEADGVKALLFKTDDDFVLVIIPVNKRVSEKKLKELLKVEKVKLAFPEEVKKVMGCETGACYPIGNIIPVKTLIDKSIREKGTISFNPGVHNKTIMMATKDYFGLAKGEVVDTSQENTN